MNLRIGVHRIDDIKEALNKNIIVVSEEIKTKMQKLYSSTDGDILSSLASVIQAVEYDVASGDIKEASEAIRWISQGLYGLLQADIDKERKEFASWMDAPAYGGSKEGEPDSASNADG